MPRFTGLPTTVQRHHSFPFRGELSPFRRFGLSLPLAILAVCLCGVRSASAANNSYYWTGSSTANWNTITGLGTTNWSIQAGSVNDPGNLPGTLATDDVYFFAFQPSNPANFSTELGANFSINSLNFLSGPVTGTATSIDGAGGFSLTLGSGGLVDSQNTGAVTISSGVVLGATQTWSNFSSNPISVSAAITGSASNNLTLAGGGVFSFSTANSYSAATTLGALAATSSVSTLPGTTLTLSGAGGSIQSTSAITLNGGSVLNLDSTAANQTLQNRIADSMGITSNGGAINLLGNGSSSTTETVGTLTIGSGQTNVIVTPGSGETATLTFGSGSIASFLRLTSAATKGGAVNFSSTGTIAAPTTTLDAGGLLGAWATIGNINSAANGNLLDFATVSGGHVVAASNYAINSFAAASNTQVNSPQTLTAASTPINSLYMTGTGTINLSNTTNTLIIGDGGIISNGATNSVGFSSLLLQGAVGMDTAAVIGNATVNATNTEGGTQEGKLSAGVGIQDLVVTTASNLRINAVITDSPNPSGTFTATTTGGSNTVALTAGTTAQLYPGVTVTGLTGLTGTQTITSIIDATHFTVGANATTGGSATAAFTSHTGLTKDGSGILDLSDGNAQAAKTTNTYTGITTINGGTLVINQDTNLGTAPTSTVTNQLTLNGGTVLTTAGFNFATTRGITVGPQGGTFGYTGGNDWLIGNRITGPGAVTFESVPNGIPATNNNGVGIGSTANDYQGATTILSQVASGANTTTNYAYVRLSAAGVIPDNSPVTVTTGGPGNGARGVFDMFGNSETIGSLAGNGNIVNTGATVTLITGQNNRSTTFSGTIGVAGQSFVLGSNFGTATVTGNANIAITKTGAGTMTLSGANAYAGATTISGGGKLLVTGSLANTAVAVNIGSLGGSGTIAGAVTVASGGHLAPAISSATTNTLTISNNLTLAGGSTLDFDLGAPSGTPFSTFGTGDLAKITGAGNVTINNTTANVTINVNPLTGFGPGIYDLVDAQGSTGTFNFQSATNFSLPPNGTFEYAIATPGASVPKADGSGTAYFNLASSKQLVLVVQNNPNPPVIWTGAAGANGNGTWDTTSSNWATNSPPFSSTTYSDGASVTFDQTGRNTNISLGGATFKPSSITISNTAGVPYTFSNGTLANAASGTTGLTKTQGGTATFNNINNFTGPTAISGGTLRIGSGGTYSSASISVSGNGSNFAMLSGGALASTSSLNLTSSGAGTFNNAAQTLATVAGDATGSLVLNGTAMILTGTGTVPVAIGGTGSLTVRSGTTTLSGTNNTYGGGTFVTQAGTLAAGANNDLPANTTLTLGDAANDPAVYDLAGFSDRIVNLVSVGNGALFITDSGATGGNQTLTINNDAATSNADITFNGTITETNSLTQGPNSLGITKNGSRMLTLGASNSFHGPTTINGGVLLLNNANAVQESTVTPNIPAAVEFGSGIGTFNLGGLAGHGDIALVDQSSNAVTLNVGATNANTTYSGALTGSGSLTKVGTGTLTLSGTSSYMGGTTVSAGTLTVANSSALGQGNVNMPAAGPIIQLTGGVSVPNSLALRGSGNAAGNGNGALLSTGGVNTWSGPITLGDANTRVGAAAGATTVLSGPITGATENGLIVKTIDKTGIVSVSNAANTWGAATQIVQGTLQIAGGNDRLATNQPLQIGSTTIYAALDLNGFNQTVAGFQDRNGGQPGTEFITNSAATAGTLTSAVTSGTSTFTGAIQDGPAGGAVGLVMNGAGGTQVLNGVSTYSGASTVNAGTLIAGHNLALGTGPVTLDGGTLRVSVNPSSLITGFGGTSTTVTGGGTSPAWTVNNTVVASNPINNNVLTLTDDIANEARTAYSNTPVPVNVGFNASFTYTPSNPAGTLATAADGVTFLLQRSALTAIGGTGGGLGYTGVTPSVAVGLNIFAGVTAPNIIGTGLGTNGAITTSTAVAPVNLVGGNPIDVSLVYDPTAQTLRETVREENTANSFTTVYSGVNIAGTLAQNSAFVGFSGATGTSLATQTISNFSFAATGTSTPATYVNSLALTGGTTSTLDLAVTAASPVVTMGTFSVGSGAGTTLNMTASTAPAGQAYGLTLGTTTLSGDVSITMAANGAGTGTLTLGAISDGGATHGITFSGGTLALTAGGSYGGSTNVSAGTLQVTNTSGSATGTGPVVLAANTTLAGTGAIAGAVNLSGHLSPGIGASNIGTLRLGSATLNNGSTLDYDLAGLAAYDKTVVTGSLSLAGNLTVNVNALAGLSLGTYNLATSTGLSGSPTFTLNLGGTGSNPNFTYGVATQGNNVVLVVGATSQKWTGAVGASGSGTWDTSSANWDPAVNGGVYADGAFQQVFDDSGANTNINIASTVAPLGILFSNNLVPYTISGAPITGSTAIVIQGPGSVTLNSANFHSGGTTLLGGTLNIGDPGALGTGTLGIAGGAIDNTLGFAMTLNNSIAQIWSGSFTFLGSSDLNLGSGLVTLTTSPTITVNMSTLTVGGAISDGGAGLGLTKAGAGTLVLASTNTYAGGTTITGGVLSIAGDSNLGSPASLTLNGGTLLVTTGTAANAGAGIATLNTNRGTTLGANGGTISIGFTNPTLTKGQETALIYNGVITGPGGLTIVGTAGINQSNQSILDISAPASYQGTTTINNAVAEVNDGTTGINNMAAVVNILPTGTTLNLINNGAWNIDSNASALTVAGLTGDASGAIGTTNNTNAAAITLAGSGTYDFSGLIGAITVGGKLGNNARVSITKTGSGIQTFDGPNTYTGGTTVTSGTLATVGPSGVTGPGALTINPTGTASAIFSAGTSQSVASLTVSAAATATASADVTSGNTVTVIGATSVVQGTLNKTSSGTLAINGSSSLATGSGLAIAGGTMRINATGSSVVGAGVTATVAASASLELDGTTSALTDATTSANRVNIGNSGNLNVGNAVVTPTTVQQVGGIDGTGTTTVSANASLTANHIVQTALIIGGTDATDTGLVTIDASDANGNPLAAGGRALSVAASLSPSDSIGSSAAGGSTLTGIGDSSAGAGLGASASGMGTGSSSAVPEPSAFVLVALALGAAGFRATRQRRSLKR